MISKEVLIRAKEFLCWDVFPHLTIKLIEKEDPVSFYNPPFNRDTIIIFYNRGRYDFSCPLFLLFHEAGHCIQYREMKRSGNEDNFFNIINIHSGRERREFEKQAWIKGRVLLLEFIKKNGVGRAILNEYDSYSAKCIDSY